MKKLFSSLVFGVLFLGLAALAFFSASSSDVNASVLPPVDTATINTSVGASAEGSLLPAENYNLIALPLDASASIVPYKSSGLATYHPGTTQVLEWRAATQTWFAYVPGITPIFLDYDLVTGHSYMLLVDASSTDVFTIVGDVPLVGSIQFDMEAGTVSSCVYNLISIPLDQDPVALAKASDVAAAVAGTDQILEWRAATQTWFAYVPGITPVFLDYDVSLGYPYMLCSDDAAPAQWP